jgi:hypothetical protein
MMTPTDKARAILDKRIDEIAEEAKRHARLEFNQNVLPLCASGGEKAAQYAIHPYTLNPIVGKALDAALRAYVLRMMDEKGVDDA